MNEILAPELGLSEVFVDAHRVTTGRRHGRLSRGGGRKYEQLAGDLLLWMKQDDGEDSWFTTMVDLYQLPSDFPGKSALPANLGPLVRVQRLEGELARDIEARLDRPVASRLIPYIQLHEFEALLFSKPESFQEAFPNHPVALQALAAIRASVGSPEDIDEGVETAPSKRIRTILPGYQKIVAGVLIAKRIGLATMRRECGHFDSWVRHLQGLGKPLT